MLTNDLIVYLKTTDTCQLDCKHCFTNGINGKKGWFDAPRTIRFFERLKEYRPHCDNGHIIFHGGEPMLAPLESMYEVWNGTKDLWPNIWWSIQTNLTYPLTDEKAEFFRKVCPTGIGTSWDKNIRWTTDKQEAVWEDNVRQLTSDGHDVTCIVCLTSEVVNNVEPIRLIEHLAGLGIQHVNFERLTSNGTILRFLDLLPGNANLDRWFLKLWKQSVEHKTYEYIENTFFNSILSPLVYRTHSGCRCRECEQKVLTINADGTVGGCPNTAVEKTYGTIDDDIKELMTSEDRMCNIVSEVIRPPACWACPVYDICNGDCHQLVWEGDICAAPKFLMTYLKQQNDTEMYKKFLGDFVGQE